jgi:SOS-response transcriptional repressor LexA
MKITPQLKSLHEERYLNYIKSFIKDNLYSPTLKQIAEHFHVTSPTAHKALKGLQEKHLLYFDRDDVSGFYIRVPERIDSSEPLHEIPILGVGDRNGELHKFPKKVGHFPVVLSGLPKGNVFSVEMKQHIPSEDMLAGDRLIFHQEIETKSRDIVIIPFANILVLSRVFAFTDRVNHPFYETLKSMMDIETPDLYWWPIGHDDYSDDFFTKLANSSKTPFAPISQAEILGTAIRLDRTTAI